MCKATVKTVYNWINEIAPFETAESFDNVGLLIGSMSAPVERILVALDATPAVVDEAIKNDVQLIVTHHPLMFRGTKRILTDDFEGNIISRLILNHISLIAAHTNLDLSMDLSGSAVMANKLGLSNLRRESFVFVGELPQAVCADKLQHMIALVEGDAVYRYGDQNRMIKTLGISGGAFDEGYELARAMGSDAYLTGEVRHHNAIAAAGSGFVLFQGGHFGTEAILVPELAKTLQNALNALKYNVTVYPSACRPYSGTAV